MASATRSLDAHPRKAHLRILATSDLHMSVLGFDYVKDKPMPQGGLARLAPLIHSARAEAQAAGMVTLLFDNGDTLQGNAMGDLLARTLRHPHPIVGAMNQLHYDAIGLGNHDFDHGLDYLAKAMRSFEMPVLSSNVQCTELPYLKPHALLTRKIKADGKTHQVKIGVLSVLPIQTATWNQNHLAGKATVSDAVATAAATVRMLKSAGADLIIVLAHMGIADTSSDPDQQNAAIEIARIEGVDVVIAGHTHVRFPALAHPELTHVDRAQGSLAGVPAALPGVGGSDLAVIDLVLDDGQGWAVTGFEVALRRPDRQAKEDPIISEIAAPAHRATRTYLSQPVGRVKRNMHTYFALADPGPVSALLAHAQMRVINQVVSGSPLAALPLLSAASSPASGGISGADHFVDLPAGEIQRRHIAGLAPFANQVWAVRINGQQLLDWLEKSAQVFHVLHRDAPDQMLLDPTVPGYHCDSMHGITYEIDPTVRPQFDARQIPLPGTPRRVGSAFWKSQPIRPDQEFLVATSHYRASGGGGFEAITEGCETLRSTVMQDEALTRYLEAPDCDEIRSDRPWRFRPGLNVSAILETSPEALTHLSDISHLKPEPCGATQDGFARIRVHL